MVHKIVVLAATLGMWSPVGLAQEAPKVYIAPDMCEGVILLGRCFGCPWDGPITAGSAGVNRPPVDLGIESGDFVCGCADAWRPSASKPDCEITRLTEDELSTLASREGDGVYYGIEYFD